MMRDIIDGFRYRFELWRREQREEYFGAPRDGSAEEEPGYVSFYADHPKPREPVERVRSSGTVNNSPHGKR